MLFILNFMIANLSNWWARFK